MTRKTIRNQACELAIKLTGPQTGFVTPSEVEPLIRMARRYAAIQVKRCNVPMNEKEEARMAQREEKLEADMSAEAKKLPGVVSVRFDGDPRGFVVALMLESGDYNTWGGRESGWGIA